LSEDFLLLDVEERREVYGAVAVELGVPGEILEKDVWICWALEVLFGDPDRLPMAFKGGTSLSKVFGAINRFSEDIDLTVAVPSADFGEGRIPTSRNRLDKLRDTLLGELAEYLRDHVTPRLATAASAVPGFPDDAVVMSAADTIDLAYPSCFPKQKCYLTERVKLEFGARNILEPSDRHMLRPYIAASLDAEIRLPMATVDVLSPERTFWEKATLAHDECGRGAWYRGAERISRHWYDLAVLADHPIGVGAIGNTALLVDVVRVKTAFFRRRTSNYDDCLSGGLRILPDADGLAALRQDYDAMIEAGMFSTAPPPFDAVVERLVRLEQTINSQRART